MYYFLQRQRPTCAPPASVGGGDGGSDVTGRDQGQGAGETGLKRSNPTKWTHLGAVSATVGVTLLHIIKNIPN